MRKMKDSGIAWIGEIPEAWNVGRLKYQFSFGKGLSITKADLVEDGIGVISYGQVHAKYNTGTSLCDELIRYIPRTCATIKEDSLVHKGDFIFADTSEDYEGCGNCVYVDKERNLYAGYHTIILKNKIADGKYFSYLFKTDFWREQIRARVSGVKVFSISQKILSDAVNIIPPLDEQRRIAAFLDEKCAHIDAVIEKTRASIDEYKKLKQAIITRAVTKGLRQGRKMKDSGIEWIGEIPKEWDISTVGRRILFEGGSQPPLTQFIHEPAEGYVRLIQNRDYKTDAYITYVPKDSVSKFCSEDDIMIGRYGPPIFVLHRGIRGAYNVALMKAIPQDIDKEWMVYVLQEYTLLKYIESFSKRAAGQDGVNPKSLKNYPLSVPPLPEQQEIAAYLDAKTAAIDRLIAKKEQLIAEMQSCKKSLIYEVVTGKREAAI